MSDNLPIKYKESIFRRIINKIKSLYEKNNGVNMQYNTNNNNVERVDRNKLYRESMRSKPEESNKKKSNSEILYKESSIEYALDQFNKSLAYQNQRYGKVNSYNALTQLSGMAIESGEGNDFYELELLNALKKQNDQFEIINQDDQNGNTYFYHIKTKNYLNSQLDKNAENMRLYINCKRKNVAKLATKLAEKFKDDSMYFKFSSDYQLSNSSRSEAFVIYTDTKNVANIIGKLKDIHSNYSELFEGAENMNPFLKTEGGYLSYAPEPKIDEYYKEKGETEKIDPSYNSFLSKALQESFVRTARETIAKSEELTLKTDGTISDDINFYIKYFQDFQQGDYSGFINQMKENLKKEAQRNNVLDIKGLDDKEKEGGTEYGE